MFRLVIIFILGIITIPYIQCELDEPNLTLSIDESDATVTSTSEASSSDSTQTDSSDTDETSLATTTEISDSSTDLTSITTITEESTTAITTTDTDSTDDTTLSIATDSTDTTILTDSSTTTPSSSETSSGTTSSVSVNTDEQTSTTPATFETTTSVTTPTTFQTTTSVTTAVTAETTTSITTAVTAEATTSITTPATFQTTTSVTTSITFETSTSITTAVTAETTTSITTPVTAETTTSVTTPQPIIRPLLTCYFNESCYGNIVLEITDGKKFNPPSLSENTEPPVAPTSDVSSITKPTTNSKLCELPYRPQLDNSTEHTTWDMWFCYNNDCPTGNAEEATCAPGLYGLKSITPQETSKTTIDALDLNVNLQNSLEQQCLRFYYYFTVRNQQDLGQNIQIWIKPNDKSEDQILLKNLTTTEMSENRWHSEEVSIDSVPSPYTLTFLFEVDASNSADDVEIDKTVYFALDNIEFYGYNCSYINSLTTTVPPTITSTTSTQTTTTPENGPPPPPESNLGTIIGLSLGIGIPVLLIVIGGIVLYKKRGKTKYTDNSGIPLTSRNAQANDDILKNPFLF